MYTCYFYVIKKLSQMLDQKALELIKTHHPSVGNRNITTAAKVGLERLQELYTKGVLKMPSYVEDNACTKPQFLSDDILKIKK